MLWLMFLICSVSTISLMVGTWLWWRSYDNKLNSALSGATSGRSLYEEEEDLRYAPTVNVVKMKQQPRFL